MLNLKRFGVLISFFILNLILSTCTCANVHQNVGMGPSECPPDNFCIVLKKDPSINPTEPLKLLEFDELRSTQVHIITTFPNGWLDEKFIPQHIPAENLPPYAKFFLLNYKILKINDKTTYQCEFVIDPSTIQKNKQFVITVSSIFDGAAYSCKSTN